MNMTASVKNVLRARAFLASSIAIYYDLFTGFLQVGSVICIRASPDYTYNEHSLSEQSIIY